MEAVLLKAGSFILIIISGYLLKKIGLFHEQDNKTIMKLIMNVTLPAAVISSFSNYQRDMSLIFIAMIGIGLNVIMMLAGYGVALKKSNRDRAFNVLNYSGYNIGTFTMPYLQSFLGSMGTVVACIFDAGNAIMCTGVTYAVASNVAGNKGAGGIRVFVKTILSSVPFDVYSIMLVFYFMNIKLPEKIYTIAGTFAGANTFLAMFMIGGAFEFCFDREKLRQIAINLLIRYGCAAIFSFCIFNFLTYSLQIRQILSIIVFAPVSTQAVINSYKCGCDEEKAGIISSMTILISLAIITGLVSYWHLGG